MKNFGCGINLKNFFLFIALTTAFVNIHAQIKVPEKGDTTIYRKLSPHQKVFYDIDFGFRNVDLTNQDTIQIIKAILTEKDSISTYAVSKLLSCYMVEYNPETPGKIFPITDNPERFNERARSFIKLFYCYYLVFPNECKLPLKGMYISVLKNNKMFYFTEQCLRIDEHTDERYIQNFKQSNSLTQKIWKKYVEWEKQLEKLGLETIRKEKITPFTNTNYKWGFDIIPDEE